jgi:maltose 6'-phosphate phosphatase
MGTLGSNIRMENFPPKLIDYIFKRNGNPVKNKSMAIIFNEDFYPTVSGHFGYR